MGARGGRNKQTCRRWEVEGDGKGNSPTGDEELPLVTTDHGVEHTTRSANNVLLGENVSVFFSVVSW